MRRLSTRGVSVAAGPISRRPAAFSPNTASRRTSGTATHTPEPVSARSRSTAARATTGVPGRVRSEASTQGTSTGWPPVPASTRTPTASWSGAEVEHHRVACGVGGAADQAGQLAQPGVPRVVVGEESLHPVHDGGDAAGRQVGQRERWQVGYVAQAEHAGQGDERPERRVAGERVRLGPDQPGHQVEHVGAELLGLAASRLNVRGARGTGQLEVAQGQPERDGAGPVGGHAHRRGDAAERGGPGRRGRRR